MTAAALSRIQGSVARQNDGGAPKGNYVGRMQRQLARTQGGKEGK